MSKLKKLLSGTLAVVMLVITLAFSSGAIYDPANTTGEFKLTTSADKTIVNPGDEITFTLSIDPGTFTDLGAHGTVLTYNTNHLTPISTTNTEFRQWQNTAATWTLATATVNFNLALTGMQTAFNDAEKAYYNKGIMMMGNADVSTGANDKVGLGWNPSAEAYCTFKMTVNQGVAPGTKIYIGVPEAAILKNMSYMKRAGGARVAAAQYNLSNSVVELTVAGATVDTPSVAKANSQVKFYGTKPTADDNFDYRLVSKITDADWDTYFANTGTATGNNRITSVGFVAHDKKDGTMNLDTAKAVAKGTAATGYKTASTTYISKANDTADATFGCLIKDIMHSTQATDIECLAYVQYVDGTGTTQYIFYDAAINAAVNTGYANALAAWQGNGSGVPDMPVEPW